jgi:hypothetical protein
MGPRTQDAPTHEELPASARSIVWADNADEIFHRYYTASADPDPGFR